MPPSSLAQMSGPTSAPSSKGGESDATLAVLQCMLGISPGPMRKCRLRGFDFLQHLQKYVLTKDELTKTLFTTILLTNVKFPLSKAILAM